MSERIGVAILGSTGSIGVSTLDVLRRHPDRFRVAALTAHRDVEALFQQCLMHEPDVAVLADTAAAERLRERLRVAGQSVEVLAGVSGLERAATLPEVAYVMAAIVGAAGLPPTLAAARAGKRVLLANKEALVMAGPLFMAAIRQHGAELLPIDSEHNALFQCLPADFASIGLAAAGVRRLLLTGSGGPFRTAPLAQLADATPEQACAHPNWNMGRKISVDSATMMNKGLEVIEAHWLFEAPTAAIEVVVHPQSVIHSMVEYQDGSVLAQLGNPDMRTPIAHALAWPRRLASGVTFLDFARLGKLEFQAPDFARFPCLRLAFAALEAGGTAPAVLNAANEVAVQAFLDRRIRFTDIAAVVEHALERVPTSAAEELAAILAGDSQARTVVARWIAARTLEV
ncbi:1-deoxy-D-xylulose-5-phosphate reductoisomerase [Candidatus Competibacter phosphatis]|uniref:1-deoxy-D-xylulose 5-phosphate reductoisomerase n=1 Tax=Candidatus Competibacter phosphatis TaxID=221280 RepID=A0ABX1TRN1_9GAMM|nr:1-deoxy-D-xylulose-5-phosphate reductoisomerase [Candidatus Competibacter phosphatis]NMQ20586.1 1-deoxy-D-xylulose-5-phosphate reductoisomerase [Candidatus Competibacter phosphatis]